MLKQIHYGWVMVTLGIFALAANAMIIYTFGIFLRPITMEFGWERGALSAAQSITLLVGGGLAILTGRLSDKYGPRPLVTANGILAGIAYLLMSQISSLWQVYLVWGLLMGVAWSCLFIPVTSTIPRWFTRKRGIAMGLAVAGASLSGVISPPLVQWLISAYGWRQAYVTLGIIALVIIIPVAQFMKHSPQRIGLKPYGENETTDKQSPASVVAGLSLQQVIKTGRFWIFGLMQFGFLFSTQLIVVHIAPHAVDIGILAMVAAGIVSIIAALNLIGKLVMGSISDRVGPRLVLTACFGMFTLALIWLLFAEQVWVFYVFAVVFGLAWGGTVSVFTLILPELFGLKYLGMIAGTAMFLGTIGGAIGPPLAGAIFDVTGSYRLAFLIGVIICGLGIIFSLILLRFKSYEDMAVVR